MQVIAETVRNYRHSISDLPPSTTPQTDFSISGRGFPDKDVDEIVSGFIDHARKLSESKTYLHDDYDIDFRALKNAYSIINEEQLKKYLDVNPDLYSFLISSKSKIINIAGNVPVTLELYTFIEEGDNSIFITICLVLKSAEKIDNIEESLIDSILSSHDLSGRIVISVNE